MRTLPPFDHEAVYEALLLPEIDDMRLSLLRKVLGIYGHTTLPTRPLQICRTFSSVFKKPEREVMSAKLIRTLLSSWPDNLKCSW